MWQKAYGRPGCLVFRKGGAFTRRGWNQVRVQEASLEEASTPQGWRGQGKYYMRK